MTQPGATVIGTTTESRSGQPVPHTTSPESTLVTSKHWQPTRAVVTDEGSLQMATEARCDVGGSHEHDKPDRHHNQPTPVPTVEPEMHGSPPMSPSTFIIPPSCAQKDREATHTCADLLILVRSDERSARLGISVGAATSVDSDRLALRGRHGERSFAMRVFGRTRIAP